MVSQNQAGKDSNEYETDAHRLLQTKSKPFLLSITPMTLENSREFVGACNELDVEREIKMHFVTHAKLAKEREGK